MKFFYRFLGGLLIWFYVCGLYNAIFDIGYSKTQATIAILVPPYPVYIGAKENIVYFANLKNKVKMCRFEKGKEICE